MELQIVILLASVFILFRGLMKLPKKVAIGITIFLVVQFAIILIMFNYYPEELIFWTSYIGVDLKIE